MCSSWLIVFGQPNATELPARFGRKEVAVCRANMRLGSRARTAAQNELIAHELAVVFAQRARDRRIARIRRILAARPLPDIAE